jgi:hypothetical protein
LLYLPLHAHLGPLMAWQVSAEQCSARLDQFCRSARALASSQDVPDSSIVDDLRQLVSAHADLQHQLNTAPADDDTEDARSSTTAVDATLHKFMLGLDDATNSLRSTLDACYEAIPEASYSFDPKDVIRLAYRIRNNASMMIKPPDINGVVEPPLPPAPQKWDMQASQLQQYNVRMQQRQAALKAAQEKEQQQQKVHDQAAASGINYALVLKAVFEDRRSKDFQLLGIIMQELRKSENWTMEDFKKGVVPVKLAAFLQDYHTRQQGGAGAATGAGAAGAAGEQAAAPQQPRPPARPAQEQAQPQPARPAAALPSWLLDEDEDDEDE